MRLRAIGYVAIGLALSLDPPGRSYGQQSQQGVAPRNPSSGSQPGFGGGGGGGRASQNPSSGSQPGFGGRSGGGGGGSGGRASRNPSSGSQPLGSSVQNSQMLRGELLRIASPYGGNNSGMLLAPADDALRAQLKLSQEEGLIVTAVDAGSPAALAGIEQNDVLLRIAVKVPQGLPLGKPEDLEEGLKAAGDTPVALLLLRRGQRLGIKVQPRFSVSLSPARPDPPSYWIGVGVASIEPALRSQLQLQPKFGLLAIEVVKDSPGEKAGLRSHDILLRLDGEALTDQDALIQIVQARGEKAIPLEIVREGKKETIQITPEKRKSVQIETRWRGPVTRRWDILLPGWVETGQNDLQIEALQNLEALSKSQGPRDGDATTSKRLDELSVQIKELRQAIEALTKAAQVKK